MVVSENNDFSALAALHSASGILKFYTTAMKSCEKGLNKTDKLFRVKRKTGLFKLSCLSVPLCDLLRKSLFIAKMHFNKEILSCILFKSIQQGSGE